MAVSAPLPGVVGAEGRVGPSALPLSAGRAGRLGACGSAIARATPRQHGALCAIWNAAWGCDWAILRSRACSTGLVLHAATLVCSQYTG